MNEVKDIHVVGLGGMAMLDDAQLKGAFVSGLQ